LFLVVVIMYLDRLCIAVAGPRMQKELSLSPAAWGWVIGVFTLSYALFEVPAGALGDRIGPRKVLTRIVLWWSAFTALTGAATGYAPLLAARFLFGAGAAGTFPNSTAVISRWMPVSERGRASSLVMIATAVGGGLTPLIVVKLQQAYGWRASFYLFGAIGVFWAAFWYWWFRDTPREKSGVSAAELAAIGEPPESRHGGVPWGAVLRDRNFQRLLAMYHAYCWGAYFFLSWLPTYLQVGRGLTEDQMRIASSLPSWASGIGVLIGGFLSDRLARTRSLRVARCAIGSSSLLAAGALLIAATLIRDNTLAVALLAAGLGCMGLMLPVAWAVCLDIGRGNAGAISGAMNMAGQAGSFFSSIAFGYLVEWFGNYDLALMPLAAMLLVSGLLFARIDPARRVAAPEPAATAV
jgi:sugar phosphate permease